ncbi:S8 family serine peptidase [Robbsia andropogonis]|uniref:S8 family serine peptidase n=1 Tax=Robbsia andropogonis TaxID=28092 RepID=UPI003D1A2835
MPPFEQTPVTVCLLDSGLLHGSDLVRHVVAGVDLTRDVPSDDWASSTNAHGSHVAETVLTECPEARLAVVRIIDNNGWLGTQERINAGFAWVLERLDQFGPVVVCAAFGDLFHHRSDASLRDTPLCRTIQSLRDADVLTVTAAGNMYPRFRRAQPQGMAWPAILRETISVGALSIAQTTNSLTFDPFSQRLHASCGTDCATTLFALPGPPGDSSGAAARVAGRLAYLLQTSADKTDAVRSVVLLATLLGETRRLQDSLTGLTWPAL